MLFLGDDTSVVYMHNRSDMNIAMFLKVCIRYKAKYCFDSVDQCLNGLLRVNDNNEDDEQYNHGCNREQDGCDQ